LKIRFLLVLCILLVSGSLLAQTFHGSVYTASLPLFDGEHNLGDVEAEIEGETIRWLDQKSLLLILRQYVQDDTFKALERLPAQIPPSLLPFPMRFSPEELKLITSIDLNIRARRTTDLGIDLEEEKRVALEPAPFAGAINYRLEQNWGNEEWGGNYFSGQFSSAINMNTLVFENQTFYQENIDPKWYRGDTRLVKDFERTNIRAQVGDVYPLIQGFMVAKPLGGINIQRNFSLNPYRLPYPTGHQNFTLKSRSFVKYYVNSVLVKSEYLAAGNYSAQDIPLNNGLNTVLIEAVDDLGQKQVFVFKSSSNINLLNEGESRFDLSYGSPFLDLNYQRKYQDDEGKVFSGFYQYGFNSVFSGSGYLQNQGDFNLLGSEVIYAIPIGNINLGHARSRDAKVDGNASSLGYQLITQGKKWFDSHTLSLRYENRSENFRTSLQDLSASVQNNYNANYTIPVSNILTFSLGGNYGDVRDNDLADRYGYDANLSFRLFNHHNISFFLSRNRDENKRWNDMAYVFLTFSIPESNNYVSALYDERQDTTRINVLRDNQNRLYSPRAQAITQYHNEAQSGELDVLYPTPVGDLGGRISGSREEKRDLSGRGSARVNSAFVFAYQESEWAGGVSRPIPGSFVIFKPEERLSDQKIGLKSTSPYTEAESGFFDEIVFSNLIAYQYRDIQLDPTFLENGRTLMKEKFILYPTYRSGHLVKLHERGAAILTGKLLNADGSPISLQVGYLGSVMFFTNREGDVFIEGVEPGNYALTLDGREEKIYISVSKDDRGLVNFGVLQFKEDVP
jgi:outer membrane usher protein